MLFFTVAFSPSSKRFNHLMMICVLSSIVQIAFNGCLNAEQIADSRIEDSVKSYSQYRQDAITLEHFFPNKKDGTFVEIGAHNGLAISNTLLMEELGWKGMLIEANAKAYEQLVVNRPNAINIFGAAYYRDGVVEFRQLDGYTEMLSGIVETVEPQHIERIQKEISALGGNEQIVTVPCYEITGLLLRHNLTSIDYMSIDVEGAEMKILQSLDFSKVDVKVLQIENNYLERSAYDEILLQHGYYYCGTVATDIFYTKLRGV